MRDGLIVKIMSGRFCKGLNYRLHYFYFDRCGSLADKPSLGQNPTLFALVRKRTKCCGAFGY
jgi:hypothetical protein